MAFEKGGSETFLEKRESIKREQVSVEKTKRVE